MSGARPGPVCVSDSNIAGLENLQFEAQQGPCRDAYRSGRSVHAPSLDGPVAMRWPPFVSLARARGIRAVSAYPLINRTVSVGVLTLYRAQEGELSGTQQDDSVAVARVLTDTLTSLAIGEPSSPRLDEPFVYRAEIYQASGMVAVHLGVPPDDALVRIRDYGTAHGISVLDVATEVVALRLRFAAAGPDVQQ